MTSKLKNDSTHYITRAAIAGAGLKNDPRAASNEQARADAERREAKATLDSRWYVRLPPKR